MKARMSSLPVLQFCGQAQITSAKGAGNSNTDIGTAFHAVCSKAENAAELVARLSDEQQKELMALIPPAPADFVLFELPYEAAKKEVPVGLDEHGAYVPKGSDAAVIDGTCDMYWVHDRTVYVADIKKSAYAAPDGAHTLQAIGYAIAIADLEGALGYHTGIWDATEGKWSWSGYVDVWGEQHEKNLDRVLAAAKNYGGEFNVGSHCSSCYGRPHCPQYLLPPELASTSLAPFTEPGAITHENALEALSLAKRAMDTAKRVEDLVKAHARATGGIVDAARGKVWTAVKCKGRTSLDRAALERDQPETAQKYTVFGADYEQFKWLKYDEPQVPTASKKDKPAELTEGETDAERVS